MDQFFYILYSGKSGLVVGSAAGWQFGYFETTREDFIHVSPDGAVGVCRGVDKHCAIALCDVKKMFHIPCSVQQVHDRAAFEQMITEKAALSPPQYAKPVAHTPEMYGR